MFIFFITRGLFTDYLNFLDSNNAEEAEVERFYEDLQYFLEVTPRKYVPFIIGGWNAKVGS